MVNESDITHFAAIFAIFLLYRGAWHYHSVRFPFTAVITVLLSHQCSINWKNTSCRISLTYRLSYVWASLVLHYNFSLSWALFQTESLPDFRVSVEFLRASILWRDWDVPPMFLLCGRLVGGSWLLLTNRGVEKLHGDLTAGLAPASGLGVENRWAKVSMPERLKCRMLEKWEHLAVGCRRCWKKKSPSYFFTDRSHQLLMVTKAKYIHSRLGWRVLLLWRE